MRDEKVTLSVEAQGLRDLQADLNSTGVVFRSDGETFEQMCRRIVGEYGALLSDVKIELERFQ